MATHRNGDDLNGDNCGQFKIDCKRHVETATTSTATTAVIRATNCAKTAKKERVKRRQREFILSRLEQFGLGSIVYPVHL